MNENVNKNLEVLREGTYDKPVELSSKAISLYEHMFKYKYWIQCQERDGSGWSITIYRIVRDYIKSKSDMRGNQINALNNGNDRVEGLADCYSDGRNIAQTKMHNDGYSIKIPESDDEIFKNFGTYEAICDIDRMRDWLYENAKFDNVKHSAITGYNGKSDDFEESNNKKGKGNKKPNKKKKFWFD
jgi:hypothetical protein